MGSNDFDKLEGKIIEIYGIKFELIDGYGSGANPGLAFALKPVKTETPVIVPTVRIKGKDYVELKDIQKLIGDKK